MDTFKKTSNRYKKVFFKNRKRYQKNNNYIENLLDVYEIVDTNDNNLNRIQASK